MIKEWVCIICWDDKSKNQPYRCLRCYVNWYWEKKIDKILKYNLINNYKQYG